MDEQKNTILTEHQKEEVLQTNELLKGIPEELQMLAEGFLMGIQVRDTFKKKAG